jgi:hypothetical protein
MQIRRSSHLWSHAWSTLEPYTCKIKVGIKMKHCFGLLGSMISFWTWSSSRDSGTYQTHPNVPSMGNTTWWVHLSGSHFARPKSEICATREHEICQFTSSGLRNSRMAWG